MGNIVLEIEGVSTSYDSSPALNNLQFHVHHGELIGIVGPNGSGKSTLLGNIGRLIPYQSGQVLFNERDLLSYSQREAAQKIGAVSQEYPDEIDFSVYDVVMMGRYPHWRFLQRESAEDRMIVEDALNRTGITDLQNRKVKNLSGGERQRVFIAQAVAQNPAVLLMDEPTSHLDIRFQIEIMDAIQELNRNHSITVIAAMHDINLAAHYCDRILILKQGSIVAFGSPREVIQKSLIEEVYGCQVIITEHPIDKTPYVVLYSQKGYNPSRDSGCDTHSVHLICGGGSGAELMNRLTGSGYQVTAGVLNIGDSDWYTARELGIQVVEETPFSHITVQKKEENMNLARKCDIVIVAPVPFGVGNLPNAEILMPLNCEGVPIVLVDPNSMDTRDYTQGEAIKILDAIRKRTGVYTAGLQNIENTLAEILKEGD